MNNQQIQYYKSLAAKHPDKKDLIFEGAAYLHSPGSNITSMPDVDTLVRLGEEYRSKQPSEISKGFSKATDEMQAAGYGAIGLAGSAVGADKVRDFGYSGYRRNMEEAEQNAPRVNRVEDIGSLDDAADWFMGTLGSLGPSVIEAGVSALAGGGIGGLAARKVGKEAIESAVEKYVAKKVGEGAAEDVVRKKARETVVGMIRQKAAATGRKAGLVAGVAPVESGSMYGQSADDVGVENASPYTALGLGLVSAASEVVGPGGELLTGGVKKLTKRAALKEVPISMVKEGFQETVQQGLGDLNALANNPDAAISGSDYINAFAAGAIGGAAFSTPGLVRSMATKDPREPQDIIDRAKTPKTRTIDINQPGIKPEELDSYQERFGTVTPAKTSAEVFAADLDKNDALRRTPEGARLLKEQLAMDEEAGKNYPVSSLVGAISKNRAGTDPVIGEVQPLERAEPEAALPVDPSEARTVPHDPIAKGLTREDSATLKNDEFGGMGLPIYESKPEAFGLQKEVKPDSFVHPEDGYEYSLGKDGRGGPAILMRRPGQRDVSDSMPFKDQAEADRVYNQLKDEAMGQGAPVEPVEAPEKPAPSFTIPEGVNVASTGNPFSKRGAQKAADAHTKKTGEKAEIVPVGGNRFGWKPVVPDIDATAHEAATSPKNDTPEPTMAQKEAGNYKKGHISISGMDIAVENPEGSVRSGVSDDGKKWETKMNSHYGYFKRTMGKDGDQVDVFVKPGTTDAQNVHVVDQVGPDGKFDEHKVVLGAKSKIDARREYLKNYEKGWKPGPVSEMSMEDFKAWLKDGTRTKEPVNKEFFRESSVDVNETPVREPQSGLPLKGDAQNNTPDASDSSAPTGVTSKESNARESQNQKKARVLDENGRVTDGKGIKPGDVFTTSSGRVTTPYPSQKTTKYHSQWLIDNAVAEAESRNDEWNADIFKGTSKLKDGSLTQADGDSLNMYLFGEQPEVKPSIFKDLSKQSNAIQPTENKGVSEKDYVKTQSDAIEKTQSDRRTDTARRKTVSEMSQDEMKRELLTDYLTGLGNKRAYEESAKKAHQISIDADALKWVNDNLGHPAGDELLKQIGNALKQDGLEAYHISGDEYYVQGDDADFLENSIKKAYSYLKDNPIEITLPDGGKALFTGGFSYGRGQNIAEAEERLKLHKTERELSGERSVRGAEPTGSIQRLSEGDKNQDRREDVHEVKPADKPIVTQRKEADYAATDDNAVKRAGKTEDAGPRPEGKTAEDVREPDAGRGSDGLPEGAGQGPDGELRRANKRDGVRDRQERRQANKSDKIRTKAGNDVRDGLGEDPAQLPTTRLTDHRIEPGTLTRQGGWKTAAKNNLDAIELFKKIQTENRNATPDEQAVLARFVGWGASELANNLFPGYAERRQIIESWAKPEWKDLVLRLRSVMTDDEIRTAARSTQYAHYTSEKIIRSIYGSLEKMGFRGGKILEPGMGVGNFIGLLPESMRGNTKYTGVEMDHITAGIAKLLYPNQNIIQDDFTKMKVPRDFFDASIGNPPFGSIKIVSDPDYAKHGFSLHNYFFAKSIDRVKPGGLLVFVTSRYTMDSVKDRARKYLADRADLLGAIRLPQTAFKENAGTDVVTDVIFLRKRGPGEPVGGESWTSTTGITLKDKDGVDKNVQINEYFEKHPEMVLGINALEGKMYSKGEYTVKEIDGDIEELFVKATENLPENVYQDRIAAVSEKADRDIIERDFNPKNKKEGGLYLHDDGKTIMWVRSGSGVPFDRIKMTDNDRVMIADYTSLRDRLKESHGAQLNDGDWEKALKNLQAEYKAFVKKHGRIKEYTLVNRTVTNEDGQQEKIEDRRFKKERLLKHDAEYSLVYALEAVTDSGEIVESASLKTRTIMRPKVVTVSSVPEALVVSLDKIGRLDLKHVAELSGKPVDEVVDVLGDMIFLSPENETYVLADEYLSGDVVTKLEEAEVAAASDPKYRKNVEALKKVQPEPLTSKDISVGLGAPWIPFSYYNEFAQDVLDISNGKVKYDRRIGQWSVLSDVAAQGYRSASDEWSTDKRGKNEILEAILNNRGIKITESYEVDGKKTTVTDKEGTAAANEVARKMKSEFSAWVWRDVDRAEKLLTIYNRKFNNIAPRKFDGSHLTLPGVTMKFDLYPHQKDAIWRVIQSGNTYLNHAVGAGKTFTMIAAGMEMRRIGLVNKPLYVVPNHMLSQFSKEFQELYPMADVLVADEENFHANNRKMFVAKATLNNPDAIVMTHSSFQLIKSRRENIEPVKEQFLDQMRYTLETMVYENESRMKIKKMEAMIEQAEQRFDSLIGEGDNVVAFEDMGVDFLFVDESHEFRKLDFTTNRQVKGIDSKGSRKSIDLYIKTLWLEKIGKGRSHVFASGTPIVNTLGEMYSLLRFFDLDGLERDGLEHFDSWANMFGEVASDYEMNSAGRYEIVERFSKFTNIPEMMARVRHFTDVLTSTQLGTRVERPDIEGGAPEIVIAPKSGDLAEYQQRVLQPRIETSKKWKPSKEQPGNPDPIINIITDGRLASIDLRFVQPGSKNNPNSKLNRYADGIIEAYSATKDNQYFLPKTDKLSSVKGGVQICFFNVGFGSEVAKNRGFDARSWVMKRFKDAGIPTSHIAWIDDYETATKKQALFKDLREGKKRILLGSARKMGTGVNVQTRLTHLHYLDPPWFPADVEQPDGRILRQGNKNKNVFIKRYATEGSYDATMWQMVARKARFIEQAWTGEKNIRSIEDVSEVSQYAMASALASGDQRVVQLVGLQADVSRLETLRVAHNENQFKLSRDLRHSNAEILKLTGKLDDYKAAKKRFPEYITTGSLHGRIDGKVYEKSVEFNDALSKKIRGMVVDGSDKLKSIKKTEVADINGAKILIETNTWNALNISISLGENLEFFFSQTPAILKNLDEAIEINFTTRSLNTINKIPSEISSLERDIESKKAEIGRIKKRIGTTFEYGRELNEKFAEMKRLEKELEDEGKEKEESGPQNGNIAEGDQDAVKDEGIKLSKEPAKLSSPSSTSELSGKQRRILRQLQAKGKVHVVSADEAMAVLEKAGIDAEKAKYMVAYHGSPHDFDQFSLDKIGTGEGAQAYGYGLYFAGNKEVAEYYRESLSPKIYSFINIFKKMVPSASDKLIIGIFKQKNDGAMGVRSQVAVTRAGYALADERSYIDSNKEQLWEATEKAWNGPGGRLYQVELAPKEDEYLLWDKPLSEQSETVKNIIREARKKRRTDEDRTISTAFYGWANKEKTGQSAHRYLEAHLGKKRASGLLKSIGIRGIKYLDGQSRAKGDGHYNYVIFDDADVKIIEKYSKDGRIQGFALPDGRAFIIPENIESGKLWGVIRHEVGVHLGKLAQDDKGFDRLKRAFVASGKKDSETGDAIRAAFARVPKDTAPEYVTEEAMAYLVESSPEIGFAKRILNYIKRLLVRLGITPEIFSAEDYALLAESALRREAKTDVDGMEGDSYKGAMTSKTGPGDISTTENPDSPMGWNPFAGSIIKTPLYHGTSNYFEEFEHTGDIGFHFGTESAALQRVKELRNGSPDVSVDIDEPSDIEKDSSLASKKTEYSSEKDRLYWLLLRKTTGPRQDLKSIIDGMNSDDIKEVVSEYSDRQDTDDFKKRALRGQRKLKYNVRVNADVVFSSLEKNDADGKAREIKNRLSKPIAAFLNIKNPIDIEDLGVWPAHEIAERAGFTKKELERVYKSGVESKYNTVKNILKSKGYDSIRYINEQEDKGSYSYIVFDSTQIKEVSIPTSQPGKAENNNSASKPLYSISPKDYITETIDETTEYLSDLYSRRGDLITGAKGIWKYKGEKVPGEKQDITWFEKSLGLVSHYSKKIPAFARTFNNALRNQDIKTMVEQELTHGEGGKKFIEVIDTFRRKHKDEYKGLSDYLNERDMNKIGYTVKEKDGKFVVRDLARKDTEYSFETEKEALDKAIELEVSDYIKAGASQDAAEALALIRTINNRSFDLRIRRFREVEQMCAEHGIEIPEIVYVENGEEIRVDLKQKLLEMGDMRGYYMPRIRKPGEHMLYATKEGENPILKYYDTRIFANAARANLEKQGYTVKVRKAGKLSEDLFEQLGSIMAQQAMINKSMEEINKGNKVVKFEDIGIEESMDGDTFVLSGDFKSEFIPTLERLGGVKKVRERLKGKTKVVTIEYRFENPKKGLEKELANELFKIDGVTNMFQTVALRFAGAFVSQYADIIRSRGSRSAMIGRSEAVGKDVTTGYEEDALTRVVRATLSLAGGEAKSRTALAMVQSITGRDISWPEFSEIKRFQGDFEAFEKERVDNDLSYVDRETFDEIRNHWVKTPQYTDYIEFINGRGIDPAYQKNAHGDAIAMFKDMMRNEEKTDRVIGTMKGLAVLKYLGFRVAAPVVNVTNMVVGVPAAMMGYGNIKAGSIPALIGNAYKDYRKFKTGRLESEDLKKVFSEIEKRGWDQAQFNHEGLAAIQNKMSFGYNKMIESSMWMFTWSEKLNRVATITAAYNGLLVSEPKLTFEERLNKAKEISDKAHGIYGKANRPAMMRGGSVGANVMQSFYVFKTFTHNFLSTLYDLGVNKKDAKAVAWMLFSPAIFGTGASMGASGLIYAIGKAMGSDDPEEDFYKAVESRFGSYAGNFSRFGIFGAADNGISVKGSLNAVGISDLPTSLGDIAGAPGAVLSDVIDGLDQLRRGNIMKGAESILPLAVGSPIKAYREYTEGVTTKSNAPVFFEGKPLKADTIDAMLRAFSFNPSRIAGAREKLWGEKVTEQAALDRRQEIYARLKKYYIGERDPEELEDINIMIAGYNARAERDGLKPIKAKNIKAILKKAKINAND